MDITNEKLTQCLEETQIGPIPQANDPPVAPTSKNYAEMWDKLRLSRNRKNEVKPDELFSTSNVIDVHSNTCTLAASVLPQQPPCDVMKPIETRGLDEQIKFISNEVKPDELYSTSKCSMIDVHPNTCTLAASGLPQQPPCDVMKPIETRGLGTDKDAQGKRRLSGKAARRAKQKQTKKQRKNEVKPDELYSTSKCSMIDVHPNTCTLAASGLPQQPPCDVMKPIETRGLGTDKDAQGKRRLSGKAARRAKQKQTKKQRKEIDIRNNRAPIQESPAEDESRDQEITTPTQQPPDDEGSFISISENKKLFEPRRLPIKEIIDKIKQIKNLKRIIPVDLDNKQDIFTDDLVKNVNSDTFFMIVGNTFTVNNCKRLRKYLKYLKEKGLAYLESTGNAHNEADIRIVRRVAEIDDILPKHIGFTLVSGDTSFNYLENFTCGRHFSRLESEEKITRALQNDPSDPIDKKELPFIGNISTHTRSHPVEEIFFFQTNLENVKKNTRDNYKIFLSNPNFVFVNFIVSSEKRRSWFHKFINSERLYTYEIQPDKKKDIPVFALMFYVTILDRILDKKIKFTIYLDAKYYISSEERDFPGRRIFLKRPPQN